MFIGQTPNVDGSDAPDSFFHLVNILRKQLFLNQACNMLRSADMFMILFVQIM
jgi:hypothetical protein